MENQKHSGLGIASFVTSLITGLLLFVLFAVAGVLQASTPGGIDDKSPIAIVIGLLIILFVLVALLSVGLGVAGLFQSDRKKVFSVLGTLISGFFAVATVAVIAFGLSIKD